MVPTTCNYSLIVSVADKSHPPPSAQAEKKKNKKGNRPCPKDAPYAESH